MNPTLDVVLCTVGALTILVFFIGLCALALTGAVALFHLAASEGTKGVAAYTGAWLFLSPLMFLACIWVGTTIYWSDRRHLVR